MLTGSEEAVTLGKGLGFAGDTALVVPESGPWRVVGSGHVVVLNVPENTDLEPLEGVT